MNSLLQSNIPSKILTTVELPLPLRQRIEPAVERGVAKNQNALIIQAVEQYLDQLERAWIDEQFTAIADDDAYQALQLNMLDEFSVIDQESWQLTESER